MEALPQGTDEGRYALRAFSDTTKREHQGRRVLGPVLACVGLGIVLLAALFSLWPTGFSPGEELTSPGAQDIAVSTRDTTYPGSDALRFEARPEVVYVYLRVEDHDASDFEATVFRTARSSLVGRLWGDAGLRVVEGGDERLGLTGGGFSGVLKFAVLPESEGRLPAGSYTVEVYSAGDGMADGRTLARKYFVVGD